MPPLFGVETEYAVTALDAAGVPLLPARLCDGLLRAAARSVPALDGTSETGLFLADGSRLYCDAGGHPELAGPECTTPWDLVCALRAGERLLLRLAEEARRHRPSIAAARLFAGNVDYAGTGATWGTHENYCHRAEPSLLRRRLVPHLVSRVIYAGAGGFDPTVPGLRFTLSPRAHHLHQIASNDSTHDRGILHLRDQPLAAGGFRREHLICGESLRSDVATWLKMGATAIVVAMVEGGVACGEDVELRAPVEALQAFVRDATCRAAVPRRGGGLLTAAAIQRDYLRLAEAHLGAPFMPPWAPEVCARWRDTLDRLEQGPDRTSRTLDWSIKLAVYRDRAERRGFPWHTLAGWSSYLQFAECAPAAGGRDGPADDGIPRFEPMPARQAVVRPMPRAPIPLRERLDAFLALRHELLEIDTRWGQLGPGGVFDALDRAGVLDHRIAGRDGDAAADGPPPGSRARVRGQAIARLAAQRDRYTAGWDHVVDLATGTRLDLSDPFEGVERWIPAAPAGGPPAEPAAAAPRGAPSPQERFMAIVSRLRARARAGGRGSEPAPGTHERPVP